MEVIFSIMVWCYAIGLLLVRRYWDRIPEVSAYSDFEAPGFSIVIPVRNEERHIEQLITSLTAIRYPSDKWEVILVNDASEDRTQEMLQGYTAKLTNFRVLSLIDPPGYTGSYKKRALTEGIKQAVHQCIATSDADCQFDPDWLIRMAASVMQYQWVMATGPVLYQSNGWFSTMLNIELASLVAIGAVSLEKGHPNLCNGANLVFVRQAFYEVDGYLGYEQAVSGDDEFLLYKIHTRYQEKVRFVKHPQVVVRTEIPESWSEFWNQRKRWGSKWKLHKSVSTRLLAVSVFVFHLSLITVAILSILGWYPWELLILQLTIKMLAEYLLVKNVLIYLGKSVSIRWFLPMQLLYSIYVVIVGLGTQFSGFTWKSRKY